MKFEVLAKRLRVLVLCLSGCLLLPSPGSTTPLNNQYDPAIIHTMFGTDKFYTKRDKAELSFHLSPYFQHTATASRACGGKVPSGNIYGNWNMGAIFFNTPTGFDSGTQLTSFRTARANIKKLHSNKKTSEDLTLERNFNLAGPDAKALNTMMYDKVTVEYEKIGLRGQVNFDFAFGLGAAIKGGVANYKNCVTFGKPLSQATTSNDEAPADSGGVSDETVNEITDILMDENKREAIARALCYDLCLQHKADVEDVHVSLYWHAPFKCVKKGDHILTFVPFLSVGAWLPLAEARDQDKMFSVPLGNDDFIGITVEGQMNLDFPRSIQVGFGGGASFFMTKSLKAQRVPTSQYQVGMIPWKADISKRPGTLWYANASFKAENFSPGFSFYFDFVYTQHLKDEICVKCATKTVCLPKGCGTSPSSGCPQGCHGGCPTCTTVCVPTAARNSALNSFYKPQELECRSSWKAQHINAGLKYDFSKCCSLGLAVQGYVNGDRTYRATTMLGSFLLAF